MPLHLENLSNRYYALRHGQSVPNAQNLIMSDPQEGRKPEYGLTAQGRKQILLSLQTALQQHTFDDQTILIVSSPLSRALESALIAKDILKPLSDIQIEEGLRERFFGEFEGQKSSANCYQKIWDLDKDNFEHTKYNVESVASVLDREEQVVRRLETMYKNISIILCGHGDPLQILETSFRGIHPSQHRTLPTLHNAELRLLNASAK
ncbi:MAG: histidine phosphatase family protein [Candidatus Peribacteraceae bacterium]|jgi:probable phosphoglycerate mutase